MKSWLASLLFATTLLGQPRNLRLPDEAAGVDEIVRALISVFDQADIVALGEEHEWKPDNAARKRMRKTFVVLEDSAHLLGFHCPVQVREVRKFLAPQLGLEPTAFG